MRKLNKFLNMKLIDVFIVNGKIETALKRLEDLAKKKNESIQTTSLAKILDAY